MNIWRSLWKIFWEILSQISGDSYDYLRESFNAILKKFVNNFLKQFSNGSLKKIYEGCFRKTHECFYRDTSGGFPNETFIGVSEAMQGRFSKEFWKEIRDRIFLNQNKLRFKIIKLYFTRLGGQTKIKICITKEVFHLWVQQYWKIKDIPWKKYSEFPNPKKNFLTPTRDSKFRWEAIF